MKISKYFSKTNRLLASFIFLAPCVLPVRDGGAQDTVVQNPIPSILIPDSKTLENERITKANDSAALAISNEVLTKDIPQLKRVRKAKSMKITHTAKVTEVLVDINGEMYQVPATMYKGYAIVQFTAIDSINRDYIEESLVDEPVYDDTLSQAIVEHAAEQIKGWRKIMSWFKKSK